jgi:hypothetical protein
MLTVVMTLIATIWLMVATFVLAMCRVAAAGDRELAAG